MDAQERVGLNPTPTVSRSHWGAEMQALAAELAKEKWAKEFEQIREQCRRRKQMEQWERTRPEREQARKREERLEEECKQEQREEEWILLSLSDAMEIGSSILDLMEEKSALIEEIALLEEKLNER